MNEREIFTEALQLVAERAVFRLVADGIELIEVAPGIDIETPVIANALNRHDTALDSDVVSFTFQLRGGSPRPQIDVVHAATGRRWLV